MSSYRHCWVEGAAIDYPVGKVVCVGRNYLDHIRELNNAVPETPLLFIKPSTAVVGIEADIQLPRGQGAVHHELELALLIGTTLTAATAEEAQAAIDGVGLALDLTLRDVQSSLKARGQPWEVAKAFDASCPLTPFVPVTEFADLQAIEFALDKNEQPQQRGDSRLMLHQIAELLAEMSQSFTLLPGDVVLTGTPAGVSALSPGDRLQLSLAQNYRWSVNVA
ncbi:2-keto-4-pentenoate hydratase/2-oxohepta-3-ene-1,7-dioic acid hydratase in catechol pathway [Sinobacterium caligoides]|uniref:2-keto-4-pentenoate hydratase/2-oxohepta-3-ene-1,7-dioic acid hydratase in catechol pathway n=1 Tax=Sinobacterium caligoides TaxID=933926 RepID=A0A3N2DGE1_9GAMM|nr:fumarylacetoacetate hydrolase family protein [Sinobacterium caligoides]ROR98863.1 2-keto-4-pentenoate hydratase/2-oxohepta-3-ene-1,7-dioic acid hydratase in catechol pathway [Sinobacterium caligoides]